MKWQNKRMNPYDSCLRKNTIAKMTNQSIWLMALVIVAIGLGPALSGVAFAYTTADDPHGPLQIYAWSVGDLPYPGAGMDLFLVSFL